MAFENDELVHASDRTFLCPSDKYREATNRWGLTHYVGVAGLGANAPMLGADARGAGMFAYDRATKLNEVKDGTANTIMLAETACLIGPWAAGGPVTVRSSIKGIQPYIGPDRLFGSFHSNGANFALADASIRFISNKVSPSTFEALCTIAGGDHVGSDF